MRIAIAQFTQETDTFTPIASDVSDFKAIRYLIGSQILDQPEANDVLDGARLYFRDKKDVELVPLLSAKAIAGGKLTEQARRYFSDELAERLRSAAPFDALLLSLHGATVSEDLDDVCGHLLEHLRTILGPEFPVVVPLDHHANITRRIMENATIVVGHETQPHDLAATGGKAAAHLYELMRRKPRITTAWVKIPMIAPQDQFLTSAGAMKQWFDEAREAEHREGVFSISLFPMQPWIDVAEGGWTVAVHTDDNPELADSIARSLARLVWDAREQFWVSNRVSPAEAVRAAVEAEQGLVVLSDTGDAVYGGAPGDSTCLLAEMVRQQIPCRAFVPLVDTRAVEQALEHGIGETNLTVGGRCDPFSEPIRLHGRIAAICRGLKLTSSRGIMDIGRTALFEVGNVQIVLMSKGGYAVNQPILYTHLGQRIEDAKMVVLKTGSNFQYFDPWRKLLIRADTPGATQSDLTALDWRKLPRPIYPLDPIPRWEAQVFRTQ